ncbi:alpha/beta-hydrolase [Pleomassaria siparia CBS 279.74]|uniref:Alpha/beta-hydrolase n=1 Tax=Pleomassaria siparia CBS 279.74 TaxID=1314801 RepID=A0A6G1KMC1_9PLEO|nr:alpha/beta-hydrolase [Pleomassaria siparia CBS 279.74]
MRFKRTLIILFLSGDAASTTINGTYQGRHLLEFNQDLFLGIPFADAPRLDNPVSLNTTWVGTRDASEYGPTCYGFGSNPLLNLTQSEDCLSLNLIRPSGTTNHDKLPVLVWFYGGGYRQGASADPMWNLSYVNEIAVENKQPLITISINYRLSFLGFPAGRQVANAGVTNLGLKDQRKALEWIQENIAAFGGDKDRVTIWSESAGGFSVAYQLMAFGGNGGIDLFRAGIMVSGFPVGSAASVYASDSQYQVQYNAIVNNTGCTGSLDTLDCLRKAPLSSIYPFEDSVSKSSWSPVTDGDFIRTAPLFSMEKGNFARVPVIIGSNSDEGLFVASLINQTIDTPEMLRVFLGALFPGAYNSTLDSLLTLYPDGDPVPPYSLSPSYPWCEAMSTIHLACGSQWRRFAAISGDLFVHASQRYTAQLFVQYGLPVYSFRFDTDPTGIPLVKWIGLGPGFATHGAELAYEMGLPPGFTTPLHLYPPVKNVSTHAETSREMVSKWVAFAYSEVNWPQYDQDAENLVFNATDKALNVHVEEDTFRAEQIAFMIKHSLELDYAAP